MFTTLFRIGRDAELRTIASGESVTDLALAYNYGRKGQDGKQPTQWIKAALWGKRAESLAPYLKKGGLIVATLDEVHIQSREHEGKTYTDLVARVVDVRLVPSAKAPEKQEQPKPKPAPKPESQGGGAFVDDDIPFNRKSGLDAL
jgi:single-strand DNA-binding protein